jgi:Domain of unknown function (DUF4268)
MKLGKFEKVELRDCWQTEDKDFTPWLAQSENIEILSREIGISLEIQGVEQNVGPFRADILCIDADSFESDGKHYVLIENQLEITDHKHLGQLMTYAAGLDAVTLIWIASKFTEEHRAALDWLNRITDETFRFFGIEIELYKIGDSLPAPRFNVVAKPNDWSKEVRRTASIQKTDEVNSERKRYWELLRDFAEQKNSFLNIKNSNRTYCGGYKFGKTGFSLDFGIPVRKKVLEVFLWLSKESHKTNFDKLYSGCYEESMEIFGNDLTWNRNDNGNSSSVILSKEADFTIEGDWQNQFEWFVTNGEKFANFFKPEIEKL